MKAFRKGIGVSLSLLIVVMLMAAFMITPASADGNPNPRVIPNNGSLYADLSVKWWQWAIDGKDLADVPYINAGGQVNIGKYQSGEVWFLAGAAYGLSPVTRTGAIPAGKSLFFPVANLVNDYPCPDPSFQPMPGESLEDFLQRTGNDYLPQLTDMFAEVDGVSLNGLSNYRATSSMFMFKADPALAPNYDPCVTGSPQPGVSVGYWIWLAPLPPGVHTLHFGTPSWGQDITYIITVKPD
jgi:hypothetical protein